MYKSALSGNFLSRRSVLATGAAFAAMSMVGPANAQAGFGGNVSLVVPYAAGGGVDVSARRLAESLSRTLGANVIVENRPGSNGIAASSFVSRSKPDGRTLLFTTLVAHASNGFAHKELPYDPEAGFVPISILSSVPVLVVVNPSFPANNIAELVTLIKERGGRVTSASSGAGGLAHLVGVQIGLAAGVQMAHVPYQGGGPALADVVGGHVDVYYPGLATAAPLIASGQLKALAVLTRTRSPSLPDVPSIVETPDFENFAAAEALPMLLAPAGTDQGIIDTIYEAVSSAMQRSEFKESAAAAGESEPHASTPSESAGILAKEIVRMGELFKAANINPQ